MWCFKETGNLVLIIINTACRYVRRTFGMLMVLMTVFFLFRSGRKMRKRESRPDSSDIMSTYDHSGVSHIFIIQHKTIDVINLYCIGIYG